jgi:hypothetical protein
MQTGRFNVSTPQQRAYIVAASDLMMQRVLQLCLLVCDHNKATIPVVDDKVMKNVIVSLTVDEYVENLHKMLFILLGDDDDSNNVTIEAEEAATLMPIAVQLQELALQRPNILTSDCKNVAENLIAESFLEFKGDDEGDDEGDEEMVDDDDDVELCTTPDTNATTQEENCECVICIRYMQAASGEITISERFQNSPLFASIAKIL